MKVLCGTDIIEISRVKDSIDSDNGNKFKERVFTVNEIEYCENKRAQKFQHYAARFAAKEAVFKAISLELNNKYDIEWTQIEVKNEKSGRPYVVLHHDINNKIQNIDISISHCKEYATANVVVVLN